MRIKNLSLALLTGFIAASAFPSLAQDYPYDDEPASTLTSPNGDTSDQPAAATASPPAALLPNEKPTKKTKTAPSVTNEAPARSAPVKRGSALVRWGVKIGLNESLLRASGNSFNGWGLEALVSLGWDLPYQPIFLELESGYRSFFMNDQPTHTIPLKFGIFLRERVGTQTLWKPGVSTSLEFRIEKDAAGTSSSSIVPGVHLSSQWEFGSFLIEPLISIYQIGGSATSLAFSFRGGYRF